MLEKTVMVLVSVVLLSFSFLSNNCNSFSLLNQCQFSIAKIIIHHAVIIEHSGITQSECLTKMERFEWPTAIYCHLSWFCGMGLDLTREYSSLISEELTPVKELCIVWVRNDLMDCGILLATIYNSGLIKGK